jgi:hypothetical protein
MKTRVFAAALLALAAAAYLARPAAADKPMPAYKVLEPIQQGNLTIFPVLGSTTHDTSQFLTLDEGMRSGDVVVTESGRIPRPMIRRQGRPLPPGGSAQVNRLVLINNSDRPLILLAGEIVTGGKQDRVVGSDRIVPPKSDPVDLSVFCVEPGRWTGASDSFHGFAAQMAQPSVRKGAMADRDQQKVWAEVRDSNANVVGGAVAAETSSYARAMDTEEAKQKVDTVTEPLNRSYEGVLSKLRDRNAVGVVVAINGRLEWLDLFASEALLQKYWPKLVRSYAAESLTRNEGGSKPPALEDAQRFLAAINGEREVSQTEADVFRETEIQGPGWKVFRLTSLLPKTGFDVHVAKMTTGLAEPPVGMMYRRVRPTPPVTPQE